MAGAILVVVIPVAILALLVARSFLEGRGEVDTWQSAADRLGLAQEGGVSSGPRLTGTRHAESRHSCDTHCSYVTEMDSTRPT